MLDKNLFKAKMQLLVDIFPNWKVDTTNKRTLNNWYLFFEDTEDEIFNSAVDLYSQKNTFPPTISQLLESCTRAINKRERELNKNPIRREFKSGELDGYFKEQTLQSDKNTQH